MNGAETLIAEPWRLVQRGVDFTDLGKAESLFALSNGNLGVRGNFDEGDPYGTPGTYLNSFYEFRLLPQAEAVYGFPESGESVVNVTDGKLIRLLVDDEPFDLRYGKVLSHERILDFKTGILERNALWQTPSGKVVKICLQRLVSLTQRDVMAIRYRVEPVGQAARIVIQSELLANQDIREPSLDPRSATAVHTALVPLLNEGNGTRALLAHQTPVSQLRVAAVMDHTIEGTVHKAVLVTEPDWALVTTSEYLQPGQNLSVTKLVTNGWSGSRSLPALRDQVEAALTSAWRTGWDGLVQEQKECLEEFWNGADVEVGGSPFIQHAVRFGLFHVMQAGLLAERRPLPAKGLTGPGYEGHAFWDTEMFLLPVLTATAPEVARDTLHWRNSTRSLARERAGQLGWRGPLSHGVP